MGTFPPPLPRRMPPLLSITRRPQLSRFGRAARMRLLGVSPRGRGVLLLGRRGLDAEGTLRREDEVVADALREGAVR